MKKRTDFWQVCLGLLLAVALLTPGIGQAREEPGGSLGMQKEKLAKDLNLTSEKAKEFQVVGEKYDQSREEIIERMRNNESELKKPWPLPNRMRPKSRNWWPQSPRAMTNSWTLLRPSAGRRCCF